MSVNSLLLTVKMYKYCLRFSKHDILIFVQESPHMTSINSNCPLIFGLPAIIFPTNFAVLNVSTHVLSMKEYSVDELHNSCISELQMNYGVQFGMLFLKIKRGCCNLV